MLAMARPAIILHETRTIVAWALLAALAAVEAPAWGQQPNLPALEDVQELKVRYRDERQMLLRIGTSPPFVRQADRAQEIAGRAEKALASGKLQRLVDDFRMPTMSVCFSEDGTYLAVGAGFGVGVGEVRLYLYPGKHHALGARRRR